MKSGAFFFKVLDSIIDFIFPPACPVCGGAFIKEGIICQDCRNAIIKCSFEYKAPPRNIEHTDNICILLPYNTHCRTLIHSLKYHGMPSIGLFLGDLMGRKVLQHFSLPENTLIVPVPLHPTRLRERGYNQSERIAQGFAAFTGLEIAETMLIRIRPTETQTVLDGEQRAHNVRNASRFNGITSLSGRSVILIDDVMTTGSTISECARALKEGGAGVVTVSVAVTPHIEDE